MSNENLGCFSGLRFGCGFAFGIIIAIIAIKL
jgi:hypothetical protein